MAEIPHIYGTSNTTDEPSQPLSSLEIEIICLKNRRTIYAFEIENCYSVGQIALATRLSELEFLVRFSEVDKALTKLEDTTMSCYALELKLNPTAKFDDHKDFLNQIRAIYFKCGAIKTRLTTLELTPNSNDVSPKINSATAVHSFAGETSSQCLCDLDHFA